MNWISLLISSLDEHLRKRAVKPFIKITLLFISACVFYRMYELLLKPEHSNEEQLLFFSIIFAFYTWLISSWVHARIALRQHTVDMLLSHSNSKVYSEYRRVFLREFEDRTLQRSDWEDGASVAWSDEADQKQIKVQDLLQTLLNEYEFIAAGIICGDLDELLLRKTIRGQVTRLIRQCDQFIKDIRGCGNDGTIKNKLVYENLLKLQEYWGRFDR